MVDTVTEISEANTTTSHRPGARVFLLALLLSIVIGLAFQGSRGLYESTEGRYAECAVETMASGNFLEPMLNQAHHWTKPPLAYYPIAAGIKLLGKNAWGARIFQALFYVLTVCLVFVAGRELWDPERGAYAALIYATSPFTIGAANTVSTDNLLVFFQCLTVALFWLAMRRRRSSLILGMWIALGLAFLTKGPVGLFPLAGIIPAYLVLKNGLSTAPKLFTAGGVAGFLVVGLGWYTLEIARHPELFENWLMHETLGRLTSNEYNRNAEFHKLFTLYLPILLFGTGPWLFLLFYKNSPFADAWKSVKEWRLWPMDGPWLYALSGFFVPLIVLTLSHSRLPLYLLPLFVPLSLGMGALLAKLVADEKLGTRTVRVTACCLAVLFVALKGGAAHYPSRKDMAQLSKGLGPVLAAHPDRPLVLVNGEPLNGLEFYLNRQIPVMAFPMPGESAVEVLEDTPPLASGTLVLLRTKHLRAAASLLPDGLFQTAYEDPNWSLIELNRPLNLKKQALAVL